MGFVEDVRAKIDEDLAQKVSTTEGELKRLQEAKQRCVNEASASKLDLLVLRRTPAGPGNQERLSKENALQSKIRDAREKYVKADQDMEAVRKDLAMYQGIQADLKKGALQLIA